MIFRRSPFLRKLEETIVVLRPIPQFEQLPDTPGVWTFCERSYPKQAFASIIAETDAKKACILRRRLAFDATDILQQEIEYFANITPPITTLAVGDMLIRIEKACQELYIEGLTQVDAMQELELANRSKTGNATF